MIGAVARVLEDEGIELVDSTKFLGPLLPEAGVLTRRAPDNSEAADIAYGRDVAQQIAGLDLGQMVVVRDLACVAIEAMEGTDETIERAARISGRAKTGGGESEQAEQDMRFDVPVIGLKTIEVMRRSNATALAIDAGRTLLFDRDELIRAADDAGIAIEAFAPQERLGELSPRNCVDEKEIVSDKPIRVAVVGVGEFGRNHVRVWREPKALSSRVSWTRMPSARGRRCGIRDARDSRCSVSRGRGRARPSAWLFRRRNMLVWAAAC